MRILYHFLTLLRYTPFNNRVLVLLILSAILTAILSAKALAMAEAQSAATVASTKAEARRTTEDRLLVVARRGVKRKRQGERVVPRDARIERDIRDGLRVGVRRLGQRRDIDPRREGGGGEKRK